MSDPTGTRRILKADQLAARWEMPITTVWAMARRGDIPAIRIGRRLYRFDASAIEEFEKAGGSAAA